MANNDTSVSPSAGRDESARVLLDGAILDGRYRIESFLGQGGMSSVYKATHLGMNRDVAIKLLNPTLLDKKSIERFQREAMAVQGLDHPNIVRVLSLGRVNDRIPYMVMEYIKGVSLAELLKERGSLSKTEALPLFLQLCDALEHAHSRGIIHRDLKPSNVLLIDELKTVKLADFGIAKILPESGRELQKLTQTSNVIGTLLYISPEQCVGGNVDRRSDIYSLGCLMYETLTGQLPITADSPFSLMHKQVHKGPTYNRILATNALGNVVLRCMEKAPQDRPQSAADVKTFLLNPPSLPERKLFKVPTISKDVLLKILIPTALASIVGLGSFFVLQKNGSATADIQTYNPNLANNLEESAVALFHSGQNQKSLAQFVELANYTETESRKSGRAEEIYLGALYMQMQLQSSLWNLGPAKQAALKLYERSKSCSTRGQREMFIMSSEALATGYEMISNTNRTDRATPLKRAIVLRQTMQKYAYEKGDRREYILARSQEKLAADQRMLSHISAPGGKPASIAKN